MESSIDDKIDEFEAKMLASCPMVNCPLKHLFLPGLYIRTILMEQGTMVTSMIHNTVHPYFIMRGKVSVFSDNLGEQLIEAPHWGITTPGTRRVLYIHETTEWTTVHPLAFITGEENDLSDEDKAKIVEGIEDLILEKHVNPLLGGVLKNNIISQSIYIK
jgi:hypothetical protein